MVCTIVAIKIVEFCCWLCLQRTFILYFFRQECKRWRRKRSVWAMEKWILIFAKFVTRHLLQLSFFLADIFVVSCRPCSSPSLFSYNQQIFEFSLTTWSNFFAVCKPCSLACSECPICRTNIADRIFAFTSWQSI